MNDEQRLLASAALDGAVTSEERARRVGRARLTKHRDVTGKETR